MKSAGKRISYRKKICFWVLLILFCSTFMVGCQNEEQNVKTENGYSEESSMQVFHPGEKTEDKLVETKDEGQESSQNAGGLGETVVESEKIQETDSSNAVGDSGETDASGQMSDSKKEEELKLPVPGAHTLANLLLTAKAPLGNTMYIWGGGWNEEDTAAGEEAKTLGVSPRWAEFAAKQDAGYNYNNTRYQIHDGLDCSGYVGWVIYNVFETENGKEGYVMGSTSMAQNFAERGWGEYTAAGQVSDWQVGDIMSMKGHVWISLGMCEDGSVVLLHASPPGVILCGTALADGSKSQAVLLAEQYMSTYYPEWFAKYPDCSRSDSYLTNSSRMRWSREVLADEEGLAGKNAGEVLEWLFGEK